MKFILSSFFSIAVSPPCFVITVFLSKLNNFNYAQDLIGDGRIGSFKLINTSHFFPVPHIPQSLSVNIGDDGILAFWLSTYEVRYGTYEALKSILSLIPSAELPAFINVEASMFIGDQERIKVATARASKLFAKLSMRESYTERVNERVSVIKRIRDAEQNRENSFDIKSDEHPFLNLENNLSDEDWYEEWLFLFAVIKYQNSLIELAKWRIEFQGLGLLEANVVSHIMRRKNEYSTRFVNWWLGFRNPYFSDWINVWRGNRKNDKFINNKAANYVFEVGNIKNNSATSYTWLMAWNKLWSERLVDHSDLRELLLGAVPLSCYYEYYVEYGLMPIIKAYRADGFVLGQMGSYLSTVRGSSLWHRVFIEFGELVLSEDYIHTGLKWLWSYGRGTNDWIVVLKKLMSGISQDEAIDTCIHWLQTARIDLRSWQDVFYLAYSISGSASALQFVARRWVTYRGQSRHDSLIEGIANGSIK